MVMSIHALRGDKNSLVIHRPGTNLTAWRPIDYLQATTPDRHHGRAANMESLAQSIPLSVNSTRSARCASATHRKTRNVVTGSTRRRP